MRSIQIGVVFVVITSAMASQCYADKSLADFYVSTTGSDSGSGAESKPFATFARAQRAVRERIAAELTKDITVLFRGGTYRLDTPLKFGPEDSGTETFSVTYGAYPDEAVVISGGKVLTGWVSADHDRWTLTLPISAGEQWTFRQLFADGVRLPRGRFPNAPETLRVESVSEDVKQVVVSPALDTADLAHGDAELVMYQNWSITRVGIESSEGGTIQLANPMGWIGHGSATTASVGKPAYVEHAVEFVDVPGEWHLDSKTNVLTYQAETGADPNTQEFVAPAIEQLIRVEGRQDSPVQNLRFRGLTFAHTNWQRPDFGYRGIQAGHYGTRIDERTYVLPVAIEFAYAESCVLEGCRVTHTGAGGIGFGAGCRGNRVSGCEITDIGANGIMVGWRGNAQLSHADGATEDQYLASDWKYPYDVPLDNVIEGNVVRASGAINHGCVGIFDAFATGTRIAHNVIYDMPYTGISVGFRWNESETSQRGTQIEFNHVYDTMKLLADGGCLYTLGYQPDSIIRGNVFHDVHRSSSAFGGAPNNGIFFDQGSKGFHVSGNTIYNTSGDAVRFNQTGEHNMTWENNRFGVGVESASLTE